MNRKTSLTGDRPTGYLHLGHYVGSLKNRVMMQHEYSQFIIVADLQALNTNQGRSDFLRENVRNIVEDYLSVGLDPALNTIFLQSRIPALHEMGWYYMDLVTLARLHRNPTVKQEMIDKGYTESVPMGFFCHPVTQAADITAFKADVVPVGEDQKPMIEQTNEIVRKFDEIYGKDFEEREGRKVLKEVKAIIGETPRLLGIDGKAKASKSMNNAIFLSDDSKTVREKVFAMYTDPDHIHVSDPGNVEGNIVFHYLDAFYNDINHLEELKSHYRKGGLGDVTIKNLLFDVLEKFLTPIRDRRSQIDNATIYDVIESGCSKANSVASMTLDDMRNAMGLASIIP